METLQKELKMAIEDFFGDGNVVLAHEGANGKTDDNYNAMIYVYKNGELVKFYVGSTLPQGNGSKYATLAEGEYQIQKGPVNNNHKDQL